MTTGTLAKLRAIRKYLLTKLYAKKPVCPDCYGDLIEDDGRHFCLGCANHVNPFDP
jgi:hypothetical protein